MTILFKYIVFSNTQNFFSEHGVVWSSWLGDDRTCLVQNIAKGDAKKIEEKTTTNSREEHKPKSWGSDRTMFISWSCRINTQMAHAKRDKKTMAWFYFLCDIRGNESLLRNVLILISQQCQIYTQQEVQMVSTLTRTTRTHQRIRERNGQLQCSTSYY